MNAAVDTPEALGVISVDRSGRANAVRIDPSMLVAPDDPVTTVRQAEYHAPVRAILSELEGRVGDDVAARNVFSDEAVASRIDAFRAEHRSWFYYDVDGPGRDLAMAIHDLAEAVHEYLVRFADAHSRCNCEERA